uniref:Rho GTPase activating protein 21b n=1 Tax=Gadus morhua TaxID=8049 RepID=A0A8C5A9L9_GADMO
LIVQNDSLEWADLPEAPAGPYLSEEEAFSWPGPKTVRLRRTAMGFGFTLRHFIVYPPESTRVDCFHQMSHDCCFNLLCFSSPGRPRNKIEPMDTIFVKQVKEGGPGHGAGLCTGDRLVKVNGASILGKTYSEVIALIQDSGSFLELCVMPKDEDILQLAYCQDAYQRSHNPYSGNACHIPEPPPLCYPRVDCKPPAMAQATDAPPPSGQACRGSVATSDLGYRKEITVPPSPPRAPYPKSQLAVSLRNDGLRTVVVPPDAAPAGRMGPSHRMDYADPAFLRARPRSVSQYPAPRKADVYPGGPGLAPYGLLPPPHFPNNHQNIDWRTYQTYREYIDNKGIHTHASRTIQERLDSLRAGGHNSFGTAQHVPPAGWVPKGVRRRSTSHERSYHGPPPRFQVPPRSASQDRMCGAERAAQARHWPPRSVSQDGLALKARSRSTDYVEAAEPAWPAERRGGGGGGGGGYGRPDQGARPSRQALPRQASLYRPSAAYGTGNMRGPPNPAHYAQGPEALQTRSSPMLAERSSHPGPSGPLADQRAKANLAGHLPQQGRSRAETLHAAAAGSGREATALGYRPSSYSAPQQRPQRPSILKTGPPLPPPPHHLPQSHMNGGRSPAEGGVVLREKPPCGKTPSPLRHPSYILAVNDDGDPAAGVAACWLPNDTRREIHMRRLDEQRQASCSSNLDESLDAIPFIDEPASPSVDREVTSIPAAAVISVAPAQVNAPPSPATPSPLIRRQLSHDQGKSCFGDRWPISSSASWNYVGVLMGCVSPVLRGFVRDVASSRLCLHLQTLDGHKSDDSSSRRDSSSDIFPDSSKEGWLNLRQLLTDKSKRVGGGMKSWKQTYGVLRGHSLTLYKDKKEGLSHASSQSDEDLQPICVKACLIDISYSDTKRKNVLRLTTSDCEYLFQAEGRDDMLSWIRVIQESSNLDQENTSFTSQDLISRKIKEYNTMMSSRSEPSPKASRQSLSLKQAFLGPKGEDDSSPPRDRASWKMGIPGLMRKPFEKKPPAGASFGVRLDDCPPAISNRFVPLIVEVCCKVVEERGLEYTGIYRVPGNNAAISNMQEELNSKGMNDIDVEEDKWRDLNVISSLLKSFFRKLPEPLFTNEKYADFIEANRAEEAVERLKELKRLIYELPEHHYETLKYLLLHLKKVAENCETNKMEPRNLAIVFGPTLVRTSEDNMTNMVNHMPDQCKIVENLIQQCDWFFSQEATDEPDTSADQESTVQSQPVPNIDHLLSNIGRTAASPGEVSDSACSDSSRSKGLWGPGKDQCSREMLRSSFFVSRKRKKPKTQPSSSDDDLDAAYPKKELPPSPWSPGGPAGEAEGPRGTDLVDDAGRGDAVDGKDSRSSSLLSQPSPPPSPRHASPSPPPRATPSPYASPPHSPALGYPTKAPSLYDDAVSDLGTMNSTSSQASGPPRARRGRAPGPQPPEAAEVCSITSDYSTTSSMTFLTGAELCALGPEARSVSGSRGGGGGEDDADDERSELISEGRAMETDSECDLSVFTSGKEEPAAEEAGPAAAQGAPEAMRPLPFHRLIECDTLSRKKASAARQKTDSESSLDAAGEPGRLSRVAAAAGRSTGSLSSSSRSESEKAEPPAWRLKITERLKCRLRTSVDDMFGVGGQRAAEGGRAKKKNIRRRHTMGGQRDFGELSVLGEWQQAGSRAELSAVDRLRPKCSSQDFSIRDWIARERHRTSNPEVSLDLGEAPALGPGPASASELLPQRREAAPGKSLSLSATAHPHKLSGAQVVQSRFYQCL